MSSYIINTCWLSIWEVRQVLQKFRDVELFLQQHKDSPATDTKILNLLPNPQELLALKLELGCSCRHWFLFCKATYNLVGDVVLSIKCYEEIVKIRCAINGKYYLNIQAVTREAHLGYPDCYNNLWIMVLNACNLGWTIFTTSL